MIMIGQLASGMTFEKKITVTDDMAARHLIGAGVKVFSTPEMVRFMERCVVDGLQHTRPAKDRIATTGYTGPPADRALETP